MPPLSQSTRAAHLPCALLAAAAVTLAPFISSCSPAKANGQPAPAEAAAARGLGDSPFNTPLDYKRLDDWQLADALLITGLTGKTSQVAIGGMPLSVRQAGKTDACAELTADAEPAGATPGDPRNLRYFLVCPMSTAPSEIGGEKWLMKMAHANERFEPTSTFVAMAIDARPSDGKIHTVSALVTAIMNVDHSKNGRSALTVWRAHGDTFSLDDFRIPKNNGERETESSR